MDRRQIQRDRLVDQHCELDESGTNSQPEQHEDPAEEHGDEHHWPVLGAAGGSEAHGDAIGRKEKHRSHRQRHIRRWTEDRHVLARRVSERSQRTLSC